MIKELNQGIVHLKPDITLEHLKEYEGKNVCVFYSVAGNDRNGFMTTVSVYGELEIHPDNGLAKTLHDHLEVHPNNGQGHGTSESLRGHVATPKQWT